MVCCRTRDKPVELVVDPPRPVTINLSGDVAGTALTNSHETTLRIRRIILERFNLVPWNQAKHLTLLIGEEPTGDGTLESEGVEDGATLRVVGLPEARSRAYQHTRAVRLHPHLFGLPDGAKKNNPRGQKKGQRTRT